MIYLIGSLRNPQVTVVAKQLRDAGLEVFDDWMAAGPEADDKWKEYEIERGRTYMEALEGAAAKNVFAFDKANLDRATAVILVAPAGKSGHLELGYSIGRGRRGYYLLDTPDRWDVMLKFCTLVTSELQEIIEHERQARRPKLSPEIGEGVAAASEVGQAVPSPSLPRGFVEQGPFNQERCLHCGREGGGCKCWIQWVSSGNVR